MGHQLKRPFPYLIEPPPIGFLIAPKFSPSSQRFPFSHNTTQRKARRSHFLGFDLHLARYAQAHSLSTSQDTMTKI
ncbi:hypothetical protein QC764_0004480 [Podospora pseudoanserina]|uniref:Uncharacterized protein n=1 Tax=Podospora pseudoanserina TaxID=2609844 RepID=A0ABR0ILE8_9PEZI|nr:hypothetical protein QC764_0004480 [Podospora pseudoanserina]